MANMTLIEAKTLDSNTNTVVFSSIPQTYTDLLLVVSARTNGAYTADTLYVTMNSSTSNFTWENIYGTGSSTAVSQSGSDNQLASGINGANSTASTFSNLEIYIPNYRNTAHNKSITNQGVVENNLTRGDNFVDSVLWNSTSSITSMTLSAILGSAFVTNSTFYLYGVDAASISAKATGGDTVQTDGTYWYHIFTSSGYFTPSQALSADVLVVAGGGGGGASKTTNNQNTGSGGGGGGFLTGTLSLSATTYGVTVGAGGAGGASVNTSGSTGSDSVFSTATALGGGAGKVGNENAGGNGGSGGGGSGSQVGGSATQGNSGGLTGYGYAGGDGGGTVGGGGGGAGGIGATVTGATNGAAGGAAKSSSIPPTTQFYSGGGGSGAFWTGSQTGGTGGTNAGNGGTGTTTSSQTGKNATANFGGGGGGAATISGTSATGLGGNGGSGIVIVRYAV